MKPNEKLIEGMKQAARDIESLARHNDEIAVTWRAMAVAFDKGDLLEALQLRTKANALARESSRRADLAHESMRKLPALDYVTWALVQRELNGHKPARSPFDAIISGGSSRVVNALAKLIGELIGVPSTVTELTTGNAVDLLKQCNEQQCRAIIEAHGDAPCDDPKCNIVDVAKQRIAELGGVP